MKLLQAKVRGTGPLIDSNWFQLSSGLNLFHFKNRETGTLFLRGLQNLNPLSLPSSRELLANLPLFEKRGKYTRHIQAHKRTAILGVFATNSSLVGELGELDNNLYETDRIEVGRRLDGSRWMNFVELSSSTRWNEIKKELDRLFQYLPEQPSNLKGDAQDFLAARKDCDRVRGEIMHQTLIYLEQVIKEGRESGMYQTTVERVLRADHFLQAREVVFERLPLMIYFNSEGDISPPVPQYRGAEHGDHEEFYHFMAKMGLQTKRITHETVLQRFDSGIELATSASTVLSKMDPIFLFDTIDRDNSDKDQHQLIERIQSVSKQYQCLFLCGDDDKVTSTLEGKRYRDSEIQRVAEVMK